MIIAFCETNYIIFFLKDIERSVESITKATQQLHYIKGNE